MAGIIVPVLEKTTYNFSYLLASAVQTIPLCSGISAQHYEKALLSVRVHARSMSAGQSFAINVVVTDPSDEDVAEFSQSASLFSASVTSASPSAVPGLVQASLGSDPFGAFLKVTLTATQGGTGGTTLFAQLSADLVLRTRFS